jgi:FMN-dependent NADH-azoreductase
MLGFIGLKDVTVVDADRQAMGGDVAQKSMENAITKLSAVAEGCGTQLAATA